MLNSFKTFLLRGNVVDLAVAVVVGTAFSAVVKSLVADVITPIIALVFGKHDFSALTFTLGGSVFRYGDLINAVITFLSVATAVFFLVVQPMNLLLARRRRGADTDPDAATRPCPECLSEVAQGARRCAFCTSTLQPVAA